MKRSIWSLMILVLTVFQNNELPAKRIVDSLALVALFNSTGGISWKDRTNWLTDKPLETWFGVTTTQDYVGGVYSLRIPNNNLIGTITDSLGLLSELYYLDLSNNHIRDTIPKELGNCKWLSHLFLNNTDLTGKIPKEIGNDTNLIQLYLHDNKLYGNQGGLTGEIPPELGNLKKLKNLRLDANYLTGHIPWQLGNLTECQDLLLGNNLLDGAFPVEIKNLNKLNYLSVDNNKLTSFIDLSYLTTLQYIAIERNRLEFDDIEPNIGVASQWFKYSPQDSIGSEKTVSICSGSSYTFDISVGGSNNLYQWFKDDFPVTDIQSGSTFPILSVTISNAGKYVCHITNSKATELTLYSRPIILFVEDKYGDSTALCALYDSTNGDNWVRKDNWRTTAPINTWYGVTTDGNCRVIGINLPGNKLTGNLPIEIGNLSELKYLNLHNWQVGISDSNNITGKIPVEIGNLFKLEYLYLGANQLVGSIPTEFGNLINLKVLSLWGNKLEGEIHKEFGNLLSLDTLVLERNGLTGSIPHEIGNLKSLKILDLMLNKLSGSIPVELGNLNNLIGLYLNDNNFSGSIPIELSNLKKLDSLYLHRNNLSGNIPAELGTIENLKTLALSYNNLNGEIPSELSNAKNLIHLYLNRNLLSGKIPEALFSLTNLKTLIIYNNKFIDSIPKSINKLVNLEFLWIYNNKFSYLPDLGPLQKIKDLLIENNRFEFDDIEPNISLSSVSFTYSPQDSLGIERTDSVCLGSPYTLDIKVGGTKNLYQWFKNDIAIDSLRADPKFTITSVSLSDTGTYYCHITNTLATELTLYSRPIKLMLLSLPNTRIMIDNGNFNDNAIKIGEQVWQSKNLDVSHYRNGDSIPEVRDAAEWANLTTGAWCYYNNDKSNGLAFGKLYNFYAVNDPRGLAPDGWHIPTDAECKELELLLGMTQSEVDYGGAMDGVFRGKMGGKLKSTGNTNDGDGLWLYPNLGATNETGFNLLPAGSRQPDAIFHDLAYGSAFWQTETWCRNLDYQERGISRYTQNRGPNGDYDKKCGLSVRCIKDIPEISDTIFICGGQEKKYFTFYQPGISSKWEITGGSVIGSSTNDTITVNWDTTNSGRIKLIRIPQNGGCEDSTERIVIYNPLPDPIIIADSTACENEAIIYYCKAHPFSNYLWHIEGGNIIGKNDSSAITVAWLSPGTGRITLIQSNTTGCIDSIEFNVRVNQTPETPIITRIGDSLSSNHFFGNQWYINGTIIDGAIHQVYFPASEGNYSVTVTDSNGCQSQLSEPFKFAFNYESVILEITNSEGNPGDVIEIPVNLQDKSNPVLSKITSLSGVISFNSTLLEPVGITPVGIIDSSVRKIPFNVNYDNTQAGPVYKFTLRAMLGNDSTTKVSLENLLANDTSVKFKTIPGRFTLRGICREGGARLINSSGSTQLMKIKPNPAEDKCEIECNLAETGRSSLSLYSSMGLNMMTIFDELPAKGKKLVNLDLSGIPSGTYYFMLVTPTQNEIQRIFIIK